MPTAKRERQRAARAARQAVIEAAHRRTRNVRRGAVAGVILVVALGAVYLLSRKPSTTTPANKTTTTLAAAPCPPAGGSTSRKTVFTASPPTCVSPDLTYTANVQTDEGDFSIALDVKDSLVTVNDFVFLARYHFYDGTPFHRVIPGFIVQGGDPNPPTAADPNPSGAQGPGYSVAGAVPAKGTYKIGTLAMAKTAQQANGTDGSEFFVVVGSQGVALPPDYSILGQVTSGMSVVDKIAADGTASGTPKVTHDIKKLTIATAA